MNKINTQLTKLYASKWKELTNEADKIKGVKPAHPLLIKVNDNYEKADIKVMIFGQETFGWHKEFSGGKNIDFLMNDYNYYLNNNTQDYFYKGRVKRKNKRTFWNRSNFKYFQEQLETHFKGKSIEFLWNNLSKIGKTGKGKQTDEIKVLENTYFNVIEKELKILQPDIIIFVTGPTRDKLLKNKLNTTLEQCSSQYKTRQLAKVIFSDITNVDNKEILAFRTYHPRYRAGRKNRNSEILELIIENYSKK
jgi:hypothetical protein